jgi:acyl-coenzyme A synthetase/AMP-(fatty) acid ligase
MHGTGLFTSLIVMSLGGSIVTLANRKFDPVELLDTIERDRVNVLVIVGDAFGRPVLEALDAAPDRWDLSALLMIVSSGVIWSEPVKAGFLRRIPSLILADLFASSEAVGMGSSIASSSTSSSTGEFTLGKHARVITAEGRDIEPGSGEVGVLALEGRGPIGYYKDSEKSAGTFKVIDGKRYSIPGDYAMVEKDCTVKLLGRGSVCINTGGEKVYPEEVEEVIKVFPGVRDAAVVG